MRDDEVFIKAQTTAQSVNDDDDDDEARHSHCLLYSHKSLTENIITAASFLWKYSSQSHNTFVKVQDLLQPGFIAK